MLSVFNVVIILEKILKIKYLLNHPRQDYKKQILPMMMSHIHQQVEMSRWVPKKFLHLEIQQLDHDGNNNIPIVMEIDRFLCFFYLKLKMNRF